MKSIQTKGIPLAKIQAYLNQALRIKEIKDNSLNGLQVGDESRVINKIGFAVDASLTAFKQAKAQHCDLLIVHHGLFWGQEQGITGMHFKRISYLIENNMALMGVHLPLDLQPEFGNNRELARLLGLKKTRPFGDYHGVLIGFSGEFTRAISCEQFLKLCETKLGTDCSLLGFGRPQIKTVGIVSGGGASVLSEAREKGLDVLLTGDGPHHCYHEAKDREMNIVFGSHYYTETVGLKALAQKLKNKFGVPVAFLDIPARVRT